MHLLWFRVVEGFPFAAALSASRPKRSIGRGGEGERGRGWGEGGERVGRGWGEGGERVGRGWGEGGERVGRGWGEGGERVGRGWGEGERGRGGGEGERVGRGGEGGERGRGWGEGERVGRGGEGERIRDPGCLRRSKARGGVPWVLVGQAVALEVVAFRSILHLCTSDEC